MYIYLYIYIYICIYVHTYIYIFIYITCNAGAWTAVDAAFAQLSEQLEHTLQEQRTDITRRLQAMEGKLLNHRTSEPLAASPRQAPPPGRRGRNVSQNGVGGAGSSGQADGTSWDPPRRSGRRSARQTAAEAISEIVEKVPSALRGCAPSR